MDGHHVWGGDRSLREAALGAASGRWVAGPQFLRSSVQSYGNRADHAPIGDRDEHGGEHDPAGDISKHAEVVALSRLGRGIELTFAPGYAGLGFSDPRRLALMPSASTDS